ncbi:MAG: elongation factor P maturation arginine rhamnosyltransferase EarP, partial [Burkholderiales bacterium]|nr:elongation factor P maturation arginine rhamnosyltransferase EarP [Burkholderiales bacterium]
MTPTAPPPGTDTCPQPDPPTRLWDVFCRVIDNHGDLGVLWRLSCQLAARGHTVRLWVDDASALAWMAPDGHPGVSVHTWADSTHLSTLQKLAPADVWIEGFGCEIEPDFIANFINKESIESHFYSNLTTWINLEYLTAEP